MKIPKQTFQVVDCASKEQRNRYSMRGVELKRLDTGQVSACCTDQRRLILVKWKDSYVSPGKDFCSVIGTDEWKNLNKLYKNKHSQINIDESGGNDTIKASCGENVTEIVPEDGNFPPYDNIIPNRTDTKFSIKFDPKILGETLLAMAKIMNVQKDYLTNHEPRIVLEFTYSNKPVNIIANNANGVEVLAVVMPCE